jgi:hypothetical protein
MCRENPTWGAPRIHGELLKLGIDIGETSVSKYMVRVIIHFGTWALRISFSTRTFPNRNANIGFFLSGSVSQMLVCDFR